MLFLVLVWIHPCLLATFNCEKLTIYFQTPAALQQRIVQIRPQDRYSYLGSPKPGHIILCIIQFQIITEKVCVTDCEHATVCAILLLRTAAPGAIHQFPALRVWQRAFLFVLMLILNILEEAVHISPPLTSHGVIVADSSVLNINHRQSPVGIFDIHRTENFILLKSIKFLAPAAHVRVVVPPELVIEELVDEEVVEEVGPSVLWPDALGFIMTQQLVAAILQERHIIVDDLVVQPGVRGQRVEQPPRHRDVEVLHHHLLAGRPPQDLLRPDLQIVFAYKVSICSGSGAPLAIGRSLGACSRAQRRRTLTVGVRLRAQRRVLVGADQRGHGVDVHPHVAPPLGARLLLAHALVNLYKNRFAFFCATVVHSAMFVSAN